MLFDVLRKKISGGRQRPCATKRPLRERERGRRWHAGVLAQLAALVHPRPCKLVTMLPPENTGSRRRHRLRLVASVAGERGLEEKRGWDRRSPATPVARQARVRALNLVFRVLGGIIRAPWHAVPSLWLAAAVSFSRLLVQFGGGRGGDAILRATKGLGMRGCCR